MGGERLFEFLVKGDLACEKMWSGLLVRDSDVVEVDSWKAQESSRLPEPPGSSGPPAPPGTAGPPAPSESAGLPAPPGAAGRAVQVLLPVWVAMLFYIIWALVNKLEDQSTF